MDLTNYVSYVTLRLVSSSVSLVCSFLWCGEKKMEKCKKADVLVVANFCDVPLPYNPRKAGFM